MVAQKNSQMEIFGLNFGPSPPHSPRVISCYAVILILFVLQLFDKANKSCLTSMRDLRRS